MKQVLFQSLQWQFLAVCIKTCGNIAIAAN